jgi:hypothetical protein
MLNASGGNVDTVLDQLAAWMRREDSQGQRPMNVWAKSYDLDGDGTDEWLVCLPNLYKIRFSDSDLDSSLDFVVLFERHGNLFTPGHVFFVDSQTWYYFDPHPFLVALEDINADGRIEAMFRTDVCVGAGSSLCMSSWLVGQWDGQRWHNLAAESISQTYSEITFEDRDSDGAKEIVMRGGTGGLVSAGLQRRTVTVYAWRNGAYRWVESYPEPSDHPYFRMFDANSALTKGDLDRALTLAKAVVNQDIPDGSLSQGKDRTSHNWAKSRIVTYAAIEAMLVYAERGNTQAMESVWQSIGKRTDLSPNPYTEAAQRLLQNYNQTGNALAACQAMAVAVSEHVKEASFYPWYGDHTERLSLDQICPLDKTQKQGPEL